ncbi:type II secretion system protein [Acidobacteriota bacterium]
MMSIESRQRQGKVAGRSGQSGFTLIEILIVVAIIAILASVAIPALQRAMLKARVGRMANDAKTLYNAFVRFNIDNSLYPSTSTPSTRAFNNKTLFPLTEGGYVKTTGLLDHLVDRKITIYDSPNIGGPDTQFYAVLMLREYPSVQILIADTDEFPAMDGELIQGCFFLVGHDIVPLDANILEVLQRVNETRVDQS